MKRIPVSVDRSRSGTTLIQMIVVISLIGVLSTAAITMVISVMRTEAISASVWVNERQFARLTDDWRKDVHAARIAELSKQDDLPTLIFKSDPTSSHTVNYIIQNERVTRRELDGEKLLRMETYRLADWSVTFGSAGAAEDGSKLESGKSLSLVCRRPYSTRIKSNIEQPRRDDRVIAMIGRDHRFEKLEANREKK